MFGYDCKKRGFPHPSWRDNHYRLATLKILFKEKLFLFSIAKMLPCYYFSNKKALGTFPPP